MTAINAGWDFWSKVVASVLCAAVIGLVSFVIGVQGRVSSMETANKDQSRRLSDVELSQRSNRERIDQINERISALASQNAGLAATLQAIQSGVSDIKMEIGRVGQRIDRLSEEQRSMRESGQALR